MPVCSRCKVDRYRISMGRDGICLECHAYIVHEEATRTQAAEAREREEAQKTRDEAAARIILTTETAHDLPVSERLEIVTAEVVVGMHLFKDIASMWSDTFGGRSKVMQNGLRDARKLALAELRIEALEIGADAVVGVDLDYSEISGGGKSMLFLVASGTAVKLHRRLYRPE